MYSQITSNKRKSVLLMTVFIAFIIGLGYLYSNIAGDATYSGVWLAIIISLLMTLISYYQGDRIALWTSGAHPVSKEENKYVYRLVENLCITAGLPAPKIYLIQDQAINAFATGRNPANASVAVTTGAIEKLTDEELEGVLAHELSHISNYDIRFMTLVAVMVGAISILAHIFFRSHYLFPHRRSSNRGGGQLEAVLMIAGVALAILSPIIAELIKLSISRRREYLADASGSLLTRYPEGLARALEKIAAENLPLRQASAATAHLFLSNPFSAKSFSKLFSTHPPVADRVKRLREMGK